MYSIIAGVAGLMTGEYPASTELGGHIRLALMSDPAIRRLTPTRSLEVRVQAHASVENVRAITVQNERVPITGTTKRVIRALAAAERDASEVKYAVLTTNCTFPQEDGSATLRAAKLPERKAQARAQIAEAVERLTEIGKPGLAKELLRQVQLTWA